MLTAHVFPYLYLPLGGVLTYLLVINLATVALTLLDRRRAKAQKRKRVAELWLYLLSLAGGATGMFTVMCATGHKRHYKKFRIGLPIMMLFHLAAVLLVVLEGPEFYPYFLEIDLNILVAYYVLINLFSAFVTNLDKRNAKRDLQRVPECWLMFFGAIGGAVGMFTTMCLIRHKTRHIKFMAGLPIFFVLQVELIAFLVSDYCTFLMILY